MQLRTQIDAIFARVLDVGAAVGSALTVLLMLTVSAGTVTRYFFNLPIPGMDELSEIALLNITFFSSAWLLEKEGHVRIDSLVTRLRPTTQRWLNIIASLFGACLSVVLVWFGAWTTLDLWHKDVVTPTVLKIPLAVCIVIIPIGSVLLVAQFTRMAYRLWYRR